MAVVGGKMIFLEPVSTNDQSHTAKRVAEDLSRVINQLVGRSFVMNGAVTDNTSCNKAAWKVLKQEFPSMFFYGCASHAFHLLVKDLFCNKDDIFCRRNSYLRVVKNW
jgi:hypothetical protein